MQQLVMDHSDTGDSASFVIQKSHEWRKLLVCPCGGKQRPDRSSDKGASGLCNGCLRRKKKEDADREPNGKIMVRCSGCGKKIRRSRMAARWPRLDCPKCEQNQMKQSNEATSE